MKPFKDAALRHQVQGAGDTPEPPNFYGEKVPSADGLRCEADNTPMRGARFRPPSFGLGGAAG